MSLEPGKSRSSKSAVVVEIGNDWFKLIQTERSRRGLGIVRIYLERFDALGPELSRSIADAFKKMKLPRRPVIGCLPRQLVNVRVLRLPSIDPEEISDMVDLQVGKQTPYSKEQIVSDFRIIGSSEGYTRVMLAIVQRDALRERFYILEEAGVEIERMSVSTEGLLNWHLLGSPGPHTPGKAMAGIDIDSFYSDFVVVSSEGLAFTRSILIGAKQLIEDYPRWKDRLIREVKQSIETFQGESPGMAVEGLIVSGAAAGGKRFAGDLGAELGRQVEAADCLKAAVSVPPSPSLSDPQHASVSLTPLVGIALNPSSLQFNLVPESVRLKRALTGKARSLTMLAVLLMAALVSASAAATLQLYLQRYHRDLLHRESARLESQVRGVEEMRQIVRLVNERRNRKFSPLALLSEIHKQTPPDMLFDQIDIDVQKGSVTLTGTSANRKDIRTLVNGLDQSALFTNVQEGKTTILANQRLSFPVICPLEIER